MIFDFHTHTFPDKIAAQAIARLEETSHARAHTDGTVDGLKASMADAGISASLVLPVATNPRQVAHVNDSSIAINREGARTGVYSFGCMHPGFEDPARELERIAALGIMGIKLHPVYQGTDFDDEKYLEILRICRRLRLIVIIHAGWDIGFPGLEHASPQMIRRAVEKTDPYVLVLAHMGGWLCWKQAAAELSKLGLYIDTSLSIGSIAAGGAGEIELNDCETAREIIYSYGADHTLFGSDSPWGGQAETLARVESLGLSVHDKQKIFFENARKLLKLPTA